VYRQGYIMGKLKESFTLIERQVEPSNKLYFETSLLNFIDVIPMDLPPTEGNLREYFRAELGNQLRKHNYLFYDHFLNQSVFLRCFVHAENSPEFNSQFQNEAKQQKRNFWMGYQEFLVDVFDASQDVLTSFKCNAKYIQQLHKQLLPN
jgi:hypothetical protein